MARGAAQGRAEPVAHLGGAAVRTRDLERLFEAIRATGPEHSVLSTDLGQKANPAVEDGLGLMADRLLAAGFDEAAVHEMAVVNTRRLAGADA